jgi:hypothetical protein|tara:strand:+ start:180 stop:563 length:384 start_codon:yes stop_codon:yes gene_type:complete
MSFKCQDIARLEAELPPAARVHFNILIQAREDWATARALEYIDSNGLVDPTALRFKKRGKLMGGFNTDTTVESLEELAEYWRSDAPLISIKYLGLPELEPAEFLELLNKATENRTPGTSRLPLDTLE